MKLLNILMIRLLILLSVLGVSTMTQADTLALQAAVQAEPSLVSQWTFDGANDAARLLDSGPAGENLTPVSTPAYTSGFDGTSTASNVLVGNGYRTSSGLTLSESMTVEYLINSSNTNMTAFVAGGLASSSPAVRFYMGVQTSGDLRLTLGENSNFESIIPAADYNNDEWYYVAASVVESGGDWVANAWYANLTVGETTLNQSITNFTTTISSSTLPTSKRFGVGHEGQSGAIGTQNFPGLIDEMAFYNTALSETALQLHLNALQPPLPEARTLLSDIAVARELPPGAPQPSDVLFSPRFGSSSLGGSLNVFAMAEAFQATRFDWVAVATPLFIADVVSRGYSYGGSMSPTTVDWVTGPNPTNQRLLGRAIDHNGNLVGAPWQASWGGNWGDVNSPEFRLSIFNHLKRIIDAGGDRIQVDDPRFTLDTIQWGGAYGPDSMNGFRDYLEANTTAAERTSAGLPSDLTGFDYQNFVQGVGGPGNVDAGIVGHFAAFYRESVELFYTDIKNQINAYAGRVIPFSANNFGGTWDEPILVDNLDYGMAELKSLDRNPRNIILKIRDAEALGKAQVFTLPDIDVTLNRQVIATTYAAGGHMIAPWDVYVGSTVPRFYGDPADFADLYGLVRDNAQLFDGYQDAAMIGPDISDSPALADPVTISGSASSEIYALTRAVPGDEFAPIVVHLVDWDDTPDAFAIQLLNEMFGYADDELLQAMLLIPGEEDQLLVGTLVGDRTEFAIPAVAPWGMLVVAAQGDFDFSSNVNGADFLAWQKGLGTITNAANLAGWESNFGGGTVSAATAASAAVPEPTSVFLLAVGGILSLRFGRDCPFNVRNNQDVILAAFSMRFPDAKRIGRL